MHWELTLVVTIYERDQWTGGLQRDPRPKHEKRFSADVPMLYTAVDLSLAMRRCGAASEKWLTRQKPDLIDQVVLVLYSMEAVSDDSHGCN